MARRASGNGCMICAFWGWRKKIGSTTHDLSWIFVSEGVVWNHFEAVHA